MENYVKLCEFISKESLFVSKNIPFVSDFLIVLLEFYFQFFIKLWGAFAASCDEGGIMLYTVCAD